MAYPPPQQGQGGYPGQPPAQNPYYQPQQQQDQTSAAMYQGAPTGGPPAAQNYPPGPPQQPSAPLTGGAYPPPQGAAEGGAPWQPGQGDAHTWDDLPQQPLDDDPNSQPPAYVPPNTNTFQKIQGYEGCGGFGQGIPMAPPAPPPPPSGNSPDMEFDSVSMLKESEVRDAMLEYVGQHCCFGKKPAEQMNVHEIQPSTALHYTLETFCESRITGYEHQPYMGGVVDGPQFGIPPAPWDIPCQPDDHFRDHQKLLEVPHTSVIQLCHMCRALGFLRCHRCHGLGRNRCITCHGSGRTSRTNADGHHVHHSCHMCGGDGRRRCHTCGGDGRIICHQCRGYRNLRCFIRLTVSYKNNKSEYILEKTDMPDKLVKEVQGTVIFEQTLPQVWPVIAYHVQEINANSQRLVDEHYRAFTDSRKLMQRQQLRAVPVTEVHYTWKDTKTRFWVYGKERQVYSPDYPHQCCWGCNIL